MTASVNDQHLIRYEISPSVADDDLNRLFAAAWDNYQPRPFQPILSRSLLRGGEGGEVLSSVLVLW